jgi:hypothetical protein
MRPPRSCCCAAEPLLECLEQTRGVVGGAEVLQQFADIGVRVVHLRMGQGRVGPLSGGPRGGFSGARPRTVQAMTVAVPGARVSVHRVGGDLASVTSMRCGPAARASQPASACTIAVISAYLARAPASATVSTVGLGRPIKATHAPCKLRVQGPVPMSILDHEPLALGQQRRVFLPQPCDVGLDTLLGRTRRLHTAPARREFGVDLLQKHRLCTTNPHRQARQQRWARAHTTARPSRTCSLSTWRASCRVRSSKARGWAAPMAVAAASASRAAARLARASAAAACRASCSATVLSISVCS